MKRAAEPIDHPLSHGQQALWLLQRLAPGNVAYVIAGAARAAGRLDHAALGAALADLARRHEALRTTFHDGPEGPVQRRHSELAPECAVISAGAGGGPERWSAFAYRPFDLERGPLVRLGVFEEDGGESTVLVLAVHHIVSDFWSLAVLVRELGALYGERIGGPAADLPAVELSPAAWGERQRARLAGPEGEALWQGWREALDGVPLVLELPTDRPRPPLQTFAGASVAWEAGADLAAAVARFGRRQGATLANTLLAAFGALLGRWTGQERLAVGVPTTGRRSREVAGLVGYLVNPVPVAVDLRPGAAGPGPGFAELVGRVNEAARAAFDRQDFPLALLTERLQPERDPSRSPVFQALFVLQKGRKAGEQAVAALSVGMGAGEGVRLQAGPLELAPVALPDPGAQFDLSLVLAEVGGGLAGRWQVNSDLFDRATAERWGRALTRLMAGGIAGPAVPVAELDLLEAAERQQVVAEWNEAAGGAVEESDRDLLEHLDLLHSGFLEQTRWVPEATALVAGDERLSYGELAARSARLAGRLRRLGVGPEVRVGVLSERDAGLIVALLGVLRAGGAYVPLDPAYPEERLRFMLADSAAPVVLVQPGLRGRLGGFGGTVVELGSDGDGEGFFDDPGVGPRNLSHVIYTSGSTGRPKGVAIEHRASAAFLRWALSAFSRAELAGVLASTSVCFDLSVFEIFAPLSAGGTVVLAANALALPELPREGPGAHPVTLVNTVPSAMGELVRARALPDSVRTVNLAGEPLPRSLAEGIYAASRAARVVNLYGPTEDTTYSTVQEVRRGEAGEPPIGRPIAGGRAVVLSRAGVPVPRGVVGELCLGGAGLARGYLGRPELTAERFVPDCWSGDDGARLYRTGDLVRQLADGTLIYLGRIDHQVKVRGFRIEMGEVEAALRALPGVREAVAVVHESAAGRGLAAYVAGEGLADGAEGRLREALAARLPHYMVPSWLVVLPSLPLTPNGKVDRKALPAPGRAAGAAARPARALTPTEELLAGLWAELLGLPAARDVAPHESFFHLGGHSLLAAQALSRVREALGVEIGLARFFELPTLAGLAAEVDRRLREIDGAAPPAPPLARAPRDRPLALSFAQERLWFLDQLEPDSAVYNIPAALRLQGALDVGALAAALAGIVARHEALRTRFGVAGGRPVQVIRPAAEAGVPLPPSVLAALPVVDLSALPSAVREAELLRVAGVEEARPFDLAAGPLLRTLLVRLAAAPAEHVLLATMHHIVSDGWSLGVFVRELAAGYRAALQGEPAALPPLAIQYADFAAWQRRWLEEGGELARQLDYWRPRLAGAPAVLSLPLDRPRAAVLSQRGARFPQRLPRATAEAAAALARAEGATPFLVLLAVFDALLLRYTGQEDLVVGSPVAGRDRLELEPLIGLFVNTLVLRCDAGGDPTVRELLARARAAALGAWAHQDIPFDKLVEAVAPQRDTSHTPLFQVMLAMQPDVLQGPGGLAALQGSGLAAVPFEVPGTTAKFDLALGVTELPDGLACNWGYRAALFDAATVARLALHFGRLLAAAAAAPGCRLSELPLLDAAERHQLVREWDALDPLPRDPVSVHELVAAWMRETPDAPALILEDEVRTYGALDRGAERVARRLRRLGIGAEDLVGLYLERSFEAIESLLGVLRVGAAVLPLDTSLPAERLAFMLADARPVAVLTEGRLAERLAAALAAPDAPAVLRVDGAASAREDADGDGGAAAPAAAPDPLAAAYVIYTSGSTGQAKGVVVSHGAFGRRIRTLAWELDRPRSLHKTTLSFDASLGEIFGPLASGRPVVLARPGGERDQGYLIRLVRDHGITQISFTASTLAVLVQHPDFRHCHSLVRVLTGGEAVPPDLPGRFASLLDAQLFNRYGPTETTISVISGRCDPRPRPSRVPLSREGEGTGERAMGSMERAVGSVSLGRPIAGAEILLLDRQLSPVPARALGEIYIGGGYLGRGYLDRPDLTAERFVPHPFSSRPGARLYATGDLARFYPDGRLDFVGRADQQVKIRGFRIELGEIEAVLASHPAVREAVVVARRAGDGAGGERSADLVAYVVPEGSDVDPAALRDLARSRLPAYMVPSTFVRLDRLPLSATGKVDRRALPEPPPAAAGGDAAAGSQEPSTVFEEAVAEIWREVLRLPRVGVEDDFFELGGHSLQVTQVLLRLRDQFGVEVPVQRFFEAPTIAALGLAVAEELLRRSGAARAGDVLAEVASEAEILELIAAEAALAGAADSLDQRPRLGPAERSGPLPLSFAQERLWFIHQLEPESPAYNLTAAVRLDGDLDREALAAAAGEIVRRHEALRTTFPAHEGRPVQVVAPPAPVALPVSDLTDDPRREERVRELFVAAAGRPFDLAAGPLLRLELLQLGPRAHVLIVAMHHIVSDGWSVGVFVRELGALYGAFRTGAPSPLPELAVQYADYAVWQRGWLTGEVLETQIAWWRERLAGAPEVLDLPSDRPRPAVRSSQGASVGFAWPGELSRGLAALARRRGATLYMALMAGFQALLARYGSGRDLPVGTPVANRASADLEPLIGFFVNTLVVRGDLAGDPGFGAIIDRVRETTLGAFTHQDLPFEKLVEALRPERSRSHAPLFQVMLVLQTNPWQDMQLPGLALTRLELPVTSAPFDLILNLGQSERGVHGLLTYADDLFDEPTAARLARHLEALLAAAVADPDSPLGDLPLLTAGELAELRAAGAGAPGAAGGPWVVEQVLARAAAAPAAPAVAGEDGTLTFGELAARALGLAARLCELGVGPESVVALLLPRSPDLVTASLAVMAAGGAFLPFDPVLPPHRLATLAGLAAGSGCRVLVSRRNLAAALGGGAEGMAGEALGLRILLVDDLAPDADGAGFRPVEVEGENLAYQIYTSGSTGTPKGISIAHRGLANLVAWYARTSGVAAGSRAAAIAGPGFDASVLEIWPNLCAGAGVWFPPAEMVLDPPALLAWLDERRITHFLPTVAVAELLLREPLPASLALRAIFAGADRLRVRPPAGASFRMFNCYGPTETTVLATAGEVAPGGDGLPDIGRPLAGFRAHVVDSLLRPMPAGAPGELCVGGAGLARGYAGRPDLTAAAFVPDPFGEPGARLYRTGDRVRWVPGRGGGLVLEFLGRIDQQVKVRGFRIELGEIEAALTAYPGVREAVVVAREDRRGDRRLVAYVAGSATEGELRADLAARLPAYMVPAAFVALPALPLTPNGKVDRRALPEPAEAAGGEGADFEAPGTELEQALAGLWQEVLEAPRIGVRDSFFDLGGHSLQVTQMLARVKLLFGVEVSVHRFFETPTLEGLSLAIAEGLMGDLGEEQLSELFEQVAGAADEASPQTTEVSE